LIVTNSKGEIAIIFASKGEYFKLPGGGIEEGEDHLVAAEREAMEEIGCKVAIDVDCLAMAEEWRNDLHQISFCLIGRLLEDLGATDLTEDEIADGLKHQWVTVQGAIQKMKESKPTSELGVSIRERDLFLVEEYLRTRS